ncbi:MAG: hypothetical protein KF678_07580 [Phycisphaeraceae bacterium]|nr:hypothetical protein [Phycisphaeraceae bacterium]
MSDSYRAICSDFYINQKLSLKLDLPRERQTVMDMFDRVRKQYPAMSQFRKYKDELALEAGPNSPDHRWIAIRANNIRGGSVNPPELGDAYAFHAHILDLAPYFLSISPLDVDYLELLFGFDLASHRNHDEVVYEALVSESLLDRALALPNTQIVDCQPSFGMILRDHEVEANFEVKTRSGGRAGREDPISVYLTLRKFNPVTSISQLGEVLAMLARQGEEILDSKVVPHLVRPIREAIGSGR